MINKAKTENGKKKEIKANEKPKLKVGKKVKEKADKIVKKKKKLKKKESEGFESNKEPQSLLKEEPVCSREIQAIDRHLAQTEGILKEEKEISDKLDNYLNSGNIKVYIDDDFVKANGNLIAKSNAILGKYENSLDNITGFIQNTLEQLEDCKCIYDI
jgi:hypothetical protein